jgi:UPF0271 protein
MKVNLNGDVGEGFGAWSMGDDEGLLDVVGSASVACGMHAGDPVVMHRVVAAAVERGVSIGAHVSFADLQGFGRRRMDVPPAEVELLVAYQVGALQAVAAHAGGAVTHVKPHGALYNMAATSPELALAIGRGVRGVDPSLVYVGLAGSDMVRAGESLGLRVAGEAFVDRAYEADGTLTPRSQPGAVLTDPAVAAARAVEMVATGSVVARDGTAVAVDFATLCIHGDEPTGVAVGHAVRAALLAAGVDLVPLTQDSRG